MAEIQQAERDKMREKCEKIVAHGINCFVNRQLIYNFPEELFADRGIMAIEHADFDGIERLALVTGARSRGGGGGGGGCPRARRAGRLRGTPAAFWPAHGGATCVPSLRRRDCVHL